jgi:transposase
VPSPAGTPKEGPPAERGHSGFPPREPVGEPVGEDHRRRRRPGLRRGQEGEGAETRHLLVDTEGPVLKAKVHVANVVDQEGIKELLEHANESFPRLKHLWLDAGYRGEEKGKGWVEKVLGWSVDLVERPRKPVPEKVLKRWAAEWVKEGETVDWQKLLPPKGFHVLPRRWVERTFLGSPPQPTHEQGLREASQRPARH